MVTHKLQDKSVLQSLVQKISKHHQLRGLTVIPRFIWFELLVVTVVDATSDGEVAHLLDIDFVTQAVYLVLSYQELYCIVIDDAYEEAKARIKETFQVLLPQLILRRLARNLNEQ